MPEAAEATAAITPSDDALIDLLGGPARPLGIRDLAAVLGGLRYIELAGFERLGKLAGAGGGDLDPAVAVWASGASLAHAWRANELEALLPVSVGLPGAAVCTRSPGPAADAFVADLGWETAAGAYRDLAACYERRLAFSHPSGEAFVTRTIPG